MIGIIGFISLGVMQYLYKYTDLLDELGAEYEIVYWDRTSAGEKNQFEGRSRVFHYPTDTTLPFQKKIFAFLKYSAFMRRAIKEAKYDKLILLTSQTAVAAKGIARKYKGRYVYDYRDVTREYLGFYKKIVTRLVDESRFTAISSPGFARVLAGCDKNKLVLSHNIRETEITPVPAEPCDKIRLGFWGILRHEAYREKFMDAFGRDARFDIAFHGTGTIEELKSYCAKNGLAARFTGEYTKPDIAAFAAETDVINCTNDNDFQMKPALPVKFIDGMRFLKPLIVQKGSYLAEYVKPYGVALEVDIAGDSAGQTDLVYNWYKSLNRSDVEAGYRRLFDSIISDEENFRNAVRDFAKGD